MLFYVPSREGRKSDMKNVLRCGFAAMIAGVLGFAAQAGNVIDWDAEKTSGNWSEGENWVGGVAPGEEDAARSTTGV